MHTSVQTFLPSRRGNLLAVVLTMNCNSWTFVTGKDFQLNSHLETVWIYCATKYKSFHDSGGPAYLSRFDKQEYPPLNKLCTLLNFLKLSWKILLLCTTNLPWTLCTLSYFSWTSNTVTHLAVVYSNGSTWEHYIGNVNGKTNLSRLFAEKWQKKYLFIGQRHRNDKERNLKTTCRGN